MTKLNKNIAAALDMQFPENTETEDTELTMVSPHEVVTLENEQLPDMADLDHSMVEGEKQLESLITKGMHMFGELYDELSEIDPKYKNRHIEVVSIIMGNTLDAVKHKTDLQLRRKELRMKEAEFTNQKPGSTNIKNANFFGSREELRKLLTGALEPPIDK